MGYTAPHTGLLDSYAGADREEANRKAMGTAGKINAMFSSFGIRASVDEVKTGQTVNTYMIKLGGGVSVSKVKNALANLAYIVGNANIRLSAPIEDDPRIGIEIPNGNTAPVCLRTFGGQWAGKSPVSFALGRGKDGDIVCDIADMPHLLIAGATGSGKSVCINSIITSIIYRTHPLAARLVLIDPKKVEFAPYDNDPHLICPVVTDAMEAVTTLCGLCGMMEERFTMFASDGCRNLEEYNAKHPHEKYPHVVCVVD